MFKLLRNINRKLKLFSRTKRYKFDRDDDASTTEFSVEGISYSPINEISEKRKPDSSHSQKVDSIPRFRDPRDPLPAIPNPNQNTGDLNFDPANLNPDYETMQEENPYDSIEPHYMTMRPAFPLPKTPITPESMQTESDSDEPIYMIMQLVDSENIPHFLCNENLYAIPNKKHHQHKEKNLPV